MLTGLDVSSFQGEPGAWQALGAGTDFAAVKITELSSAGLYVDPDAAADWAWLRQRGLARIAYLFGHPSQSAAGTVGSFEAHLDALGLDDGDGIALDLEVGDGLSPKAVSTWAQAVMFLLERTFGRRPLLYTYRDFALTGSCAGLDAYPLWISDPDHPAGHPQVPAPWSTWAIHQYQITGIDRDIAVWADVAAMRAAIGRTPSPVPAPPPALKEKQMILVQVSQDEVPAGSKWPGVFLLGGFGLRHVTSPADLTALVAAGLNHPVTISWEQYLTLGGTP